MTIKMSTSDINYEIHQLSLSPMTTGGLIENGKGFIKYVKNVLNFYENFLHLDDHVTSRVGGVS
jgi:hypothetical protein